MQMITEADFRRQLKNGLSGGYLFFGDEDYLKQLDLDAARKTVAPDEAFAFFNDLRLDALDFSPSKLLDALMPLPMGAEQKIVTLTGLAVDAMRPSELDALCDALAAINEYDYNVVILSVPSGLLNPGILPKRPSAALTKLSQHLTPVHFERSTPSRLASWCGKHFEHNKVSASPEVCRLVVELCGSDMFVLSGEIDKISYYVLADGKTAVTEDDVRYVAISSTEHDAFAFANALMEGRNTDALTILADMKRRRIEPIVALSEITRVFCDLYTVFTWTEGGVSIYDVQKRLKFHEYKARLYQKSAVQSGARRLLHALSLTTEADILLKQSPSDGYAAIERVICAL
ncbi:MAG: DNA polymerase III subunit delta [Clostridia bacterium]|nr:DNA polymerase III subunit delta [Clostridia bacterium]MBR2908700.1 DNA polymerase III subunit delta [Clostridia bacterium]